MNRSIKLRNQFKRVVQNTRRERNKAKDVQIRKASNLLDSNSITVDEFLDHMASLKENNQQSVVLNMIRISKTVTLCQLILKHQLCLKFHVYHNNHLHPNVPAHIAQTCVHCGLKLKQMLSFYHAHKQLYALNVLKKIIYGSVLSAERTFKTIFNLNCLEVSVF